VARAGSRRPWRRDEIDLIQQVAGRAWDAAEQARTDRERVRLLHAAEAANRSKDEFIAMLGHELRNPLSPIVTALQLIKIRGSGDWEREGVVIERQVRHLVRLVDDLLDVSRIVRGRVELKRECLEIGDVVARAVEVAGPLLEERAQRLVVDTPRNGLVVNADPERLAQVVSNLLTNAAKYTPRGGSVSVSASRRGPDVVLSVRDTGIGIPADMLPHVFELFVQGKQAIDRAGGGLGLGLAIVRNLVERHGGHVEARSDGPGLGSEFTVLLPHADQAPQRASDPPTLWSSLARTAETTLPGILIVDDNHDGADMLSEVLTRQGYRTVVAYDGIEALRLAARFKPDVALLDLGLPVMDGYELADRLRLLPGLASITLIALTGYGQPSDRARTRAVGFHHHLVKPIDLEELERLVSAITTPSSIRAIS
jgi:signal transduction histidine kinase/ActR/RegA family two-component response regulator